MTTQTIHAFEAAGLGKAPFRFIGAEDTAAGGELRRIGNVGGAELWTTPGGTCEFCGHAIIILCQVESSDGRRFHVGSDCIQKVGDAGLKKVVAAEVRKRRNDKRKAREAKKIAEGAELLAREDIRAALAADPHPLEWRAAEGDTRLDWAEWMMRHAGNRGKLEVCAALKKLDA